MKKTNKHDQIFVGDIYQVKVRYEDNSSEYKIRPVVVIDVDDGQATIIKIAPITGAKPSDPPKKYDVYKIPIFKWKEAGLEKQSFVKSNQILIVDPSALYKFIGKMDRVDLDNLFRAINK